MCNERQCAVSYFAVSALYLFIQARTFHRGILAMLWLAVSLQPLRSVSGRSLMAHIHVVHS